MVGTKYIPAPDRGPETVVTHVFINHSCNNYKPALSSMRRLKLPKCNVSDRNTTLFGNYLIGKHTIQNYKKTTACILAMMTVEI